MTFRIFPDLYRTCKYFVYGSYGPLIGKGCYYLITCEPKYLLFIYLLLLLLLLLSLLLLLLSLLLLLLSLLLLLLLLLILL